jgi:hypothetical protein
MGGQLSTELDPNLRLL